MGWQSTANLIEALRTIRETFCCGGAMENNQIGTMAIRNPESFSGGNASNENWILNMAGEEHTREITNK